LSTLDRDTEVSQVDAMNQNKRSIVRRRTQQLVYLELGRDNGGVMLNLSEDGCGFQAITPVKCGETRFAFQISGGRRIAGDAEIVWVDDVGIMGGLRFLNLPLEARKQIRRWLEETRAPEEHGAFEPTTEAPLDAVARGMRGELGREAAVGAGAPRDYRQGGSYPGSVGAMEEEPPASPAWAHLRATAANMPPIHDDRFAMPGYRDDGAYAYAARRPRSVALWRSIAVLAVAIAIAAVAMAYQHDVGTSLIWLGETLTGKTKASGELPESKSAPVTPTADANGAGTGAAGSAALPKLDEPKTEQTDATARTTPGTTLPPTENQPPKIDPIAAGTDRQESILEKEAARDKSPDVWDSTETVESLWGAVQGGSVSAERTLAERFVRGEGVKKNCDQAKVLLKAAAERGSKEARLRLYELETGGCR
jgi:PilZ domain